jgi:hypothetical protein
VYTFADLKDLMRQRTRLAVPRYVKIFSAMIGIIFLIGVLTVESGGAENSNFSAKCPRLIETTLELAVGGGCCIEIEGVAATDYLPLFSGRTTYVSPCNISPHIYRGPPLAA